MIRHALCLIATLLLAAVTTTVPASAFTLGFSTYLGGTSSETAANVALDGTGGIVVAGQTASVNFPTTVGAFRPGNGGFAIPLAYASRFDASGTLLWSTYLGGIASGGGDLCNDVAVDRDGNVILAGATSSRDFPVTPDAADRDYNGGTFDGFLAKLDPTGSTLVYGTYVGTSARDSLRGVAADATGNAIAVGFTDQAGLADVLLASVDPTGRTLRYGIRFGGSGIDQGNRVALDAAGDVYLTGDTVSGDFPVSPGALQPALADTGVVCGPPPLVVCAAVVGDAFVAKVNSSATALLYSTYLGSDGTESGTAIAVDAAGNAFVTGSTTGGVVRPFPVTPGAFQPTIGGNALEDAFVAKVNPTGSGLLYATYLGGTNRDGASAIAVDALGRAVVTGFTRSTNFPTANPVQATKGDTFSFQTDAFVAQLGPTGATLPFATYLGGDGDDGGSGIAADAGGAIVVVGFTSSPRFPVANAFQASRASSFAPDAFVTRLVPDGGAATVRLSVTGTDDPDPVVAGGALTYRFTVRNDGTTVASAVTLVVDLPSGVAPTSAPATCTGASSLSCALGTLAPGATSTVAVTVTPSVAGTITATAVASAFEDDADPTDNVVSLTTTVTPAVGPQVADLDLTVTASPDPVVVGTTLTYTLAVSNAGPAAATGVIIANMLPANVTLVSALGDCAGSAPVVCTVGTLAPGASTVVMLRVRPDAAGPLTNRAIVTADSSDPTPPDVTTTTQAIPQPDGPNLTGVWVDLARTCKGTGAKQKCSLKGHLDVRNAGTQIAPKSQVRIVRSVDATPGPDDVLLKTLKVAKLIAQKTKRFTVKIPLPVGSQTTGQSIIATIDSTNAVAETDETDNLAVFGPLP